MRTVLALVLLSVLAGSVHATLHFEVVAVYDRGDTTVASVGIKSYGEMRTWVKWDTLLVVCNSDPLPTEVKETGSWVTARADHPTCYEVPVPAPSVVRFGVLTKANPEPLGLASAPSAIVWSDSILVGPALRLLTLDEIMEIANSRSDGEDVSRWEYESKFRGCARSWSCYSDSTGHLVMVDGLSGEVTWDRYLVRNAPTLPEIEINHLSKHP